MDSQDLELLYGRSNHEEERAKFWGVLLTEVRPNPFTEVPREITKSVAGQTEIRMMADFLDRCSEGNVSLKIRKEVRST